jgi:hypothetical protein
LKVTRKAQKGSPAPEPSLSAEQAERLDAALWAFRPALVALTSDPAMIDAGLALRRAELLGQDRSCGEALGRFIEALRAARR